MNLEDKTYLDLLEMRKEINDAINEYGNREKIQVYSINIPYNGWDHYLDKGNAMRELHTWFGDEEVFCDEEFSIKLNYLTKAECEYCKDYNPKNI